MAHSTGWEAIDAQFSVFVGVCKTPVRQNADVLLVSRQTSYKIQGSIF